MNAVVPAGWFVIDGDGAGSLEGHGVRPHLDLVVGDEMGESAADKLKADRAGLFDFINKMTEPAIQENEALRAALRTKVADWTAEASVFVEHDAAETAFIVEGQPNKFELPLRAVNRSTRSWVVIGASVGALLFGGTERKNFTVKLPEGNVELHPSEDTAFSIVIAPMKDEDSDLGGPHSYASRSIRLVVQDSVTGEKGEVPVVNVFGEALVT